RLLTAGGGDLPGIGSTDTDSDTRGLEAYFGSSGVGGAGQIDAVGSTTTTNQYFADVNGDGITDLVVGTSVLFGRIGSNDAPVYGVSSDTPVTVTGGHLDTSGIVADLTALRTQLSNSFPLTDTLRSWLAPYSGTVSIGGGVGLSASTAAARATSTV